jgi:hypothetical protein
MTTELTPAEGEDLLSRLPEQYRAKAERTFQSLRDNPAAVPLIDSRALEAYLQLFINAFFVAMGPEMTEESHVLFQSHVASLRTTVGVGPNGVPPGVLLSSVLALALSVTASYNAELAKWYAEAEGPDV